MPLSLIHILLSMHSLLQRTTSLTPLFFSDTWTARDALKEATEPMRNEPEMYPTLGNAASYRCRGIADTVGLQVHSIQEDRSIIIMEVALRTVETQR